MDKNELFGIIKETSVNLKNKVVESSSNLNENLKVKLAENKKNYKEKKSHPLGNINFLGKLAYILVKIEFIDEAYNTSSLGLIDFDKVRNVLIKDLNTQKYRRIQKREIYSYYIDGDLFYLKLQTGEVLKIKYN